MNHETYGAHRDAQVAALDFETLVVHECERYLVLNKPFDLRIDGEQWPVTLASLYRSARPELPYPPKFCHQLDYSTSGIIALAKTRKAAGDTGKLFQRRQTLKVYSAVLFGRLAGDCCVSAAIASTDAGNRMRIAPVCTVRFRFSVLCVYLLRKK